jgi:RimJ/RimL family protein N-acetyltransferase
MYQPPYGDRVVTLLDGTFVGMVGVVPSLGPYGLLPAFRERLNENADPNQFIAEVGLFWAALNAHRGQGYMTEAARRVIDYLFTTYNLNRVVAQTDDDNLVSIAVMRRLGMIIDRNPQDDPPWLQVVGLLESKQSTINPQDRIETSEGQQQ